MTMAHLINHLLCMFAHQRNLRAALVSYYQFRIGLDRAGTVALVQSFIHGLPRQMTVCETYVRHIHGHWQSHLPGMDRACP
jgi:hypothetical protein